MTKLRMATFVVTAGLAASALAPAALGQGLSPSTGVFGSQGLNLSKSDTEILNKTIRQAVETLPNGQEAEWENPETGTHGIVVPVNKFERKGLPCREVHLFVTPRGKDSRHFRLPLCKVPEGTWKIAF